MQDLERYLAALRMHCLRDDPVRVRLFERRQLAATLEGATRLVRGEATGDNETHVTSGTLREVGGEARKVSWIVFEAGVHRTHQHAVLQCREAERKRGHQARKGGGISVCHLSLKSALSFRGYQRSARRRIFPTGDFGSVSRNSNCRGTLYPVRNSRQ